ncbi:MAG: c-type cytochrome [Ignavibacteriae bacterium]|nr:c-type cytochrome [Ignavibacteria bacterium]MBI3363874.1 c-type cytochrome [Ignavibacteriota bacterium]
MKIYSTSSMFVVAVITASLFSLGWILLGGNDTPEKADPATLAKGKTLYDDICATCHGINGNGDGVLAANLQTKPRNFTSGTFKFRSTLSGQLPTDEDLSITIKSGTHSTAMTTFETFSPQQIWALVQYIKTFSPRFSDSNEYPLKTISYGNEIPFTRESIAKGRKAYVEMQCNKCHGDAGEGDGPSAESLVDNWGDPIQPSDLTNLSALKFATSPAEIFRTFATGLDGTPMPSYSGAMPDSAMWELADYVYSLQTHQGYYEPIRVEETK